MKKYRLYIDESGTHSYSMSQQANKRYLALIGIAVKQAVIEESLLPNIRKLKALISPDPDEVFTLHREEIIARSGRYAKLQHTPLRVRWNQEVFALIRTTDFVIFTVVIDKMTHQANYPKPEHPYHYCLRVLLEKYIDYLDSVDGKGDVIAEARGKKEDEALSLEYERIYRDGTSRFDSLRVQARLSSNKIKLKPKSSIAGLELADLLVLASKLDVLLTSNQAARINSQFMRELIPKIQAKYYRHESTGKIIGYGKEMIEK